jgi:putative flavoprotein involved in K+ transport
MKKSYKIIIVGAGASGLGIACCLRELGIKEYVILERDSVGAAFKHWPKETRFITPSFTSNAFGIPDLNAITPLTSPALTLQTEHPTGLEYAQYLEILAKKYKLPVKKGIEVFRIEKQEQKYILQTTAGDIEAEYVIFAAGEFFYPNKNIFKGSQHATHTATIPEYKKLIGEKFTIIGGYESGIDAACALAGYGKKVTVIDSQNRFETTSDDPSLALSPRTRDRLKQLSNPELLTVQYGSPVTEIKQEKLDYKIVLANGTTLRSVTRPILAAGFATSTILIENLITRDEKQNTILDPLTDEVVGSPNLYLSGPMVHHGDAIFCFIYKNRQRYAVIASSIAKKLGVDTTPLEQYRRYQMFLDDLSCCEGSCGC